MKVKIITGQNLACGEPEVVIYCEKADEEIEALASYINALSLRIVGLDKGRSRIMKPEEIFYMEAVDGKTFAYLADSVWQVPGSLEALEKQLAEAGDKDFFRISKNIVVNLKCVRYLTSTIGNRLLAGMENGEEVLVSRHYARLLRSYLKTGGRSKQGKEETGDE